MSGRELPVLPPNVTLPGCLDCGACCRDIDIPLTKEELHFLDEAGTIFSIKQGPNVVTRQLPDGRRLYTMVGWCGNLVRNAATNQFTCKIYHQPGFPAACSEFIEGGPNCRIVQLQHHVITDEHLAQPGAEEYLDELVANVSEQQ